MIRMILAAALAVLLTAPVSAQDIAGPSDSARYTFYRVQDIFLRLDVRTGRVSECSWNADGWSCKVAPDERSMLETEIDRLTASNLALKKELLTRGFALPEGINPDPPLDKRIIGETKLPPFEFSRVTSYMGNVWRRMVAMVANLQRDTLRKG